MSSDVQSEHCIGGRMWLRAGKILSFHIYIHIHVLAAGSCFWIVQNQMHLSGYDVQFGFCKALAPRSGVCFQSMRFVWTEYRLLKAKWCGPRNSSKFAILLRAYFCAKAHWVVLLSTRRSAKFEQLSATHCNSDSYFLLFPWQCNLHGMGFPWNPWNLGNSSDL